MELRGLYIAVAILGSGYAAVACTLKLDVAIACGDLYPDEDAGEECEPGLPSTYINACVGTNRPAGEGACDPITCQIINDREQCAICGDGIVDDDRGEECDDDNLNGRVCPGRGGQLQCTSDCKLDYSECDPCGNGMVDQGEECDEPGEGGGFVMPRACAGTGGTEGIPPLVSPYPMRPYTSGETSRCTSDCRYDRLSCGYCGNGELNVSTLVDESRLGLPEWCDGDLFDRQKLEDVYGTFCNEEDGLRPNARCSDDCLGFVGPPSEELPCCLVKGELCPATADGYRCCYEFAHPDEPPCQVVLDSRGQAASVCR